MQSGARSRSLEVLWQAAGKVHDVGRAVPKPTEAAVHAAAAAASRIGPYLLALFTSNHQGVMDDDLDWITGDKSPAHSPDHVGQYI